MKLTHTENEILAAAKILEDVKEKASEITLKNFEIVEQQTPKSTPSVTELEFDGEFCIATNNLDHQYDYVGQDDLTFFRFPTEWLFMNDEEIEQELIKQKLFIEASDRRKEQLVKEQRQREQEQEEIEQLKNLQKKYPTL